MFPATASQSKFSGTGKNSCDFRTVDEPGKQIRSRKLQRVPLHTFKPKLPTTEGEKVISGKPSSLSGPRRLPRKLLTKRYLKTKAYTPDETERMKEFLREATVELISSYDSEKTTLDFETTENRPSNVLRSFTHALSAVLVVVVCETILVGQASRLIAAAIVTSLTWTWEIGRRRSRMFDEFMRRAFRVVGMSEMFHPEEWHKVTSWTWYVTALVFLCCLPTLSAAYAGLMVLGFGDPAAGFVGRRYGFTRVPGAGRKTFEGALAFIVVGFGASLATLLATGAGCTVGASGAILISFAAVVGGCVAELFHVSVSRCLDDNFAVPVVAGACAYAISKAAGFAP
uniref:Membrane protein n=1 Tax=Tetraselmis sp. GSL018 TaxID=582737 RepID=A0A061RHL6_9CHLO|mmetsp:Transcript_43066/g.102257  ORF Transcript_43066/g.102257 Transcript_43066/m.102257 type:complete len:342 (+) Transcript_43066:122-1147(+)